MVKPGNISLSKASQISGLDERTIGLLSVSGMWPPIQHYRDGAQINAAKLQLILGTERWRIISRTRYLTSEEAHTLGLSTGDATLAFCVGNRQFHDRNQVLIANAVATMLNHQQTTAYQTNSA